MKSKTSLVRQYRSSSMPAAIADQERAGAQGNALAKISASPKVAVQRAFNAQIQNSPLAMAQKKAMENVASQSAATAQLEADEELMGGPAQLEADEEMNGAPAQLEADEELKGSPAQLETDEELKGSPAQLVSETRSNDTGLPDNLKAGIESLSGISMDGVKVHYNSSQPAQLNSLAYAQGTDIHVAPGQEQHLSHEAWHVVQQAQGRVMPTMQMKEGVPVNDDPGLEHEADVMGAKAAEAGSLVLPAERQQHGAGSVQPRLVETTSATSQRVTQYFRDNLLIGYDLAQATLPTGGGGQYSYTNSVVNNLVKLVTAYRQFENGALDMAVYMPGSQQADVYREALHYLHEISNASIQVLKTIGEDEPYAAVNGLVNTIQNCALNDYKVYQNLAAQASNVAQDAYNRAFKLGAYSNPYAAYPQDYITPVAFKAARQAGILQLHMVKWWRSGGFPGFNAEVEIHISGYLWALAHIKWNVGAVPAALDSDPYHYNFKAPDNSSFPGEYSAITDDSVQTSLLGECFYFVQMTSAPWSKGENDRYR